MSSSDYAPSQSSQEPLSSQQATLISLWSTVVAFVGGCLCGLVISEFGTLGAASLWLLGEAAGAVGKKIVPQKNKMVGFVLAIACLVSFVVAEVWWLRWNTVQGEESWIVAVRLLPTFVKEYTRSTIIGAIFAAIGANAAYRHMARRYRTIHVADD